MAPMLPQWQTPKKQATNAAFFCFSYSSPFFLAVKQGNTCLWRIWLEEKLEKSADHKQTMSSPLDPKLKGMLNCPNRHRHSRKNGDYPEEIKPRLRLPIRWRNPAGSALHEKPGADALGQAEEAKPC